METKDCKCGKKMIKRSSGFALLTYPPQFPQFWWCACGNTESAETIKAKAEYETAQELWERVNEQTTNTTEMK